MSLNELTLFVLQNVWMLFDDDHTSVAFSQRGIAEKDK